MIPLRDDIDLHRVPGVIITLIYLNVIVFGLELTVFETDIQEFALRWGLTPAALLDPAWAADHGPPNWLSLLSHMFLHASLMHLASNMLFLWIFGRAVEDRMGHLHFLIFYLLSGLASGLLILGTSASEPIPAVGASGAVSGVMVAHVFMFPSSRIRMLLIIVVVPVFLWIPSFIIIGYFLLLDIIGGGVGLIAVPGMGGIAHWGHLGGFLFGLAAHRLFLWRSAWRGPDDHLDL